MNKRIAIISVSSILLVAAVIGTVTYGVEYESDTTTGPAVSSSSKAAHTICQSTDYKDTCEKSLVNVTDNSDFTQMIQVAFKATIKGARDLIKKSSLLKEASKDPKTAQAFDICEEVLESSIRDIQRSVDRVSTFDQSKMNEYLNDVQTWLSGAITYQQTCLDAFENKTGDNGEKMKKLMRKTSELSSNGLAMVNQLSKIFSSLQIPGFDRRRLLDEDYCPDRVTASRRLLNNDCYNTGYRRRLLEADIDTLKPNVVVAQDGSGQFKTIQEAINTAPRNVNETFIILVKAGVYQEYVEVPFGAYNVFLLGEGPTKTKITGNKNFVDGVETFKTATVVVNGDNFIAKDIGFENSAGAVKLQAVALRVSADKSMFYNCQIDGFQDTLYAHTHRQLYRNCVISGTIDFIFGDAAAVFENCTLVVRKPIENQACVITAQGRSDPRGKGAIVLQSCNITAEQEFLDMKPVPTAYLGRPWREYSRTMVMHSYINGFISPEGWAPWSGDFALNTLSYYEYQNKGPGSKKDKRVKWGGIKKKTTPEEAKSFGLEEYIEASEWVKSSGVGEAVEPAATPEPASTPAPTASMAKEYVNKP